MTVGSRELPQLDHQKGQLLVPDRILSLSFTRQSFQLPDVPLARLAIDAWQVGHLRTRLRFRCRFGLRVRLWLRFRDGLELHRRRHGLRRLRLALEHGHVRRRWWELTLHGLDLRCLGVRASAEQEAEPAIAETGVVRL